MSRNHSNFTSFSVVPTQHTEPAQQITLNHVTPSSQSEQPTHYHLTSGSQSEQPTHYHVTRGSQSEQPTHYRLMVLNQDGSHSQAIISNGHVLNQGDAQAVFNNGHMTNQHGSDSQAIFSNGHVGINAAEQVMNVRTATSKQYSLSGEVTNVRMPSAHQYTEISASGQTDAQQYDHSNTRLEDDGDESQTLLCSETFISPTPPSDDSNCTHSGASVIWPPSDATVINSPTTTFSGGKGFLFQAINGNGTSSESVESVNEKAHSGYLLKAALLGTNSSKTEYLEKDINSNFQTKCAGDTLKFHGNDAESVWRMSGSNGYDRNRMTGSSAGAGNNSLSRLSDGSGAQGQAQPQVAAAEGMLLGRVGGTGGVAVHDLNTRSIVTGTAGAGPQVTVGSVFRPPQTVSDSPRYGTSYSTAAGSSAVGPFSPLHAGGSHGASLGPYAAFYSQYPGYSSSVMAGTVDPQFGSYSAVLQSIGTHAAQSQVPRSPYRSAAGGTGVLGQYSLPTMAQASPGGKAYPGNTSLGTSLDREDIRYKREQESDSQRRYSTGILKDDKSHQFSVPSCFTEPTRSSYSASSRESPSHKRELSTTGDFYKIPTGREGSLKHRILRPSDSTSSFPADNTHSAFKNTEEPSPKRTKYDHSEMDKETSHRVRISEFVRESESGSGESGGRSTHLHYPHHFMKGSIIQLGNGEYKRVEELETEDFIHSADVSSDLKIDSSTVVHIKENETQGTAVLGFVVGEHKVQVTVEATVEHPFFVFGQGWSSCEPAWTLKRYGLECHKLTVGDVCISLTHKEVTAHAAEISKQQKQQRIVDGGSSIFDKKDIKVESPHPAHGSPGQRNKSPGHSHNPASAAHLQQGQCYRSDSGQNQESSVAPVKGERSFGSPASSQIPACLTQEQMSLPSTGP